MQTTLPRYNTTNNIAYYKVGHGPSILMIHGVGLRIESWVAQIEILSKNFTVVAIDLPGHGKSANLVSSKIDINAYVKQIKLFADEIIKDKFIIIGHSLGALIAIDYAAKYNHKCHAVLALNCIYERSNEAMKQVQLRAKKIASEEIEEVAKVTIERWFGKNSAKHLADICYRWLQDCNIEGYVKAYNAFASVRGASDSLLALNNLPIAFITGTLDKNSTVSMSQDMAKNCSKGIAKIVQGAGHMAQMSHPTEINSLIESFIMTLNIRMK